MINVGSLAYFLSLFYLCDGGLTECTLVLGADGGARLEGQPALLIHGLEKNLNPALTLSTYIGV